MESSRSSTQTMKTISSNIVETLLYMPFLKPQELRFIYWCKWLLFKIFCWFCKVILQPYRPQFKWNQTFLPHKQWRPLLLTSLKVSFIYNFLKPQKRRLIYWCKRLFFKIFCGFCKIRFQRYPPQFKWNQAFLPDKKWRPPLLTSLKLSLIYHL